MAFYPDLRPKIRIFEGETMANNKNGMHFLGVDLLCCFATMLLLGLSYFDVMGFAQQPVTSYMTALPIAARWLCLSGALTLAGGLGYVMSARRYSASYFKIFIRLCYIYLLGSALSLLIRIFLLQETLTAVQIVQEFLSFRTSFLAPIVGMYFLLLFAAPFLNAAFHDLGHRRPRQVFLILLAFFGTLQPILQFGGVVVLPTWCLTLAPIAAYVGGAYIRRYLKRRRDVVLMVIFFIILLACQTAIVLAMSMAKGELYCPWLDSMAALPCLFLALCLVGIFRSKHQGDGVGHRFFGGAAGGILPAILLGDPLLRCLLPALEERFPDISIRLWAGFGVIPVLFILCTAVGLLLQFPVLAIRNVIRASQLEDEEVTEDAEDTENASDASAPKQEKSVAPKQEKSPAADAEAAAADAYEVESNDAIDEPDEVIRKTVSLPLSYTQPLPQASENSSRHTITVPVVQPEHTVKLTQPPAEKPIGVHEVRLPEKQAEPPRPKPVEKPAPQPKSYTLDDILSEQGIQTKHVSDSVDDLIAELTK